MQASKETAVTIIIAEPLPIVRGALCALLAAEPGFLICGETSEGHDLVGIVARLKPHLLIMDPDFPGTPAGQLMAEARAVHPDMRVLILAGPQHAAVALRLLAAGASGCFLKSDHPAEFLRGVRAAAPGELAISSGVARSLLGQLVAPKLVPPAAALTEREREILDLLTAGLSNKEIAQRLYLSVRTVEVHLRNVYAKLGVRTRLEAVTRATRQELP